MDDSKGSGPAQYENASRFNARVALHARFATNPRPWPAWVFDQLEGFEGCSVLELGCGTGMLWQVNAPRVPASWTLVLTDSSEGMLAESRRRLDGLAPHFELRVMDAQEIDFPDRCLRHRHRQPRALPSAPSRAGDRRGATCAAGGRSLPRDDGQHRQPDRALGAAVRVQERSVLRPRCRATGSPRASPAGGRRLLARERRGAAARALRERRHPDLRQTSLGSPTRTPSLTTSSPSTRSARASRSSRMTRSVPSVTSSRPGWREMASCAPRRRRACSCADRRSDPGEAVPPPTGAGTDGRGSPAQHGSSTGRDRRSGQVEVLRSRPDRNGSGGPGPDRVGAGASMRADPGEGAYSSS